MKTILVVDDSASMRQMITFTLKRNGYSVLEAKDGLEGEGLATKNKVDLMITDVNMPKKNGFELIRSLRQQSQYKFTPMLMLTTEAGMDKKSEGKAAGATGWIVKPFNPEQLLNTVKKVL